MIVNPQDFEPAERAFPIPRVGLRVVHGLRVLQEAQERPAEHRVLPDAEPGVPVLNHHPKGDLMKTANIALGKEPALELED